MRKFVLYAALAALIPAVSGCDFFRRIAGRPDSGEIEAKKAAIALAEESRLKAARDSVELRDSLALIDSIRHCGETLVETRNLPDDTVKELEHRYYIIVGSFRTRENAAVLARRLGGKGYEAFLVRYGDGLTAVGICPADTLEEAYSALRGLYGEPFCPGDVWILDSRQGL